MLVTGNIFCTWNVCRMWNCLLCVFCVLFCILIQLPLWQSYVCRRIIHCFMLLYVLYSVHIHLIVLIANNGRSLRQWENAVSYCLCQDGHYVIGSVCLYSFCHSVCMQDYCKSNEPISLKLGVMIGPTNWNNWLTFGGDPVPGTDFGSLFHFHSPLYYRGPIFE